MAFRADGAEARPLPRSLAGLARRLAARRFGRAAVIAIPTVWLAVFFLVPFLVVAKISLSEPTIAQPPFLPMFTWAGTGVLEVRIDFSNYLFLLEDTLYVAAYLESVQIAAVSTVVCLLIGYPMAYFIARARQPLQNVLLLLVILPFWTSFLLRVYAWIGFMSREGLINQALMGVGIVAEPVTMLQTDFAVYVGIIYTYLPFMVLPLYANLVRLDRDLEEAASDLGARPATRFLTVTLPMSVPGIVGGSLLVFIPAIGEFVIPALLGGPDTLMIGRILWDEFFANRDWPVASAVAVAILLVVVIPIAFLRNVAGRVGGREAL